MNGRKPSLTSLVAFAIVLTPLAYVMSYAPVVRVCEGSDPVFIPGIKNRTITMEQYPPYSVADWLIHHTLLREPLFLWAEIWGVRERFESAESRRQTDDFMEEFIEENVSTKSGPL